MYGLKDTHIKKIQSVFANYANIDKAILYGSRAKGNYRNGSDIDLTLIGETLDFSTLLKIENELDDLLLPYKIDLSVFHKIENPDLVDHINRVGKVFYVKEGTEWKDTDFGKIPAKWDLKKVVDIKAENKYAVAMGPFGSNIKAENFVGEGVPVIRGTNMNFYKYVDGEFVFLTEEKADELIGSNCKEGDLVFSHRGTIGQVGLIPKNKFQRYVISQSGMKLTVNTNLIDNEFLFYFFKSEYGQFQITKYESQVGVPSISNPLTSLKEIEVPVPPLPEQKAISSVLSSLDDKIDLLNRQNRTLEQMAETLFRQWFVEEAKEDWKEGVLPDEFDFLMGQSPKGNSFNEEGIGTPMYQGNADFDFRFPNRRVYTTEAKRLAKKYDTLISVRAPVGEQNMAFEKCCIGRGVARFRYKNNNNYYTYTYFKLRSLMNDIKHFNNEGTVFGSISKTDFETLPLVIPPKDLIDKFQTEVKPLDDKVIKNVIQIRTLEKMRDTLLPKLMSGEVRVNFN